MTSDEQFEQLRAQMVRDQLQDRDIHDARLLQVMLEIPRHAFVPPEFRDQAYADGPLPIGDGQTISQPYVVAVMTQELHLLGAERVLEIGTGSGYQTAVLCRLARYVYSIERSAWLAEHAAETLSSLGFDNVDLHIGDGSQGLPDMAPFNAIIVTAAAPSLPGPLCTQLDPHGGRMVIPVGDHRQQTLQRVTREGDQWHVEQVMAVKFVPLRGRYGFTKKDG